MLKKLQRPQVPHAEATKKVLAKLRAMTPEQARETFIKAGILTRDGKLAERYGGECASTAPAKP